MTIISKLSVLIINYNSHQYLAKLINSLNKIDNIIGEIIIIDNGSKYFKTPPNANKKVKIIRHSENLGFAKAVNIGIRKSKSKFVLLLNPDTYLIDDSIKILFKQICSDKNIGIIGGQMYSTNNLKKFSANNKPNFLTGLFEFTNLKKIFPKNKYSKEFWPETDIKITNPIEVSSVCGAFMLFRKKQNGKLALFNEKYFLYLEDLEYGLATRNRGYKVIFDPRAKIVHFGGRSNNSKYRIVLKEWYKSRKLFFNEHLGKIQGAILSIIFSLEELLLKIFHFIKNEPNH